MNALRKALAVMGLVLTVAACTSRAPSGPATTAPSTGPAGNNALTGVRVPDAFTPLTVAPISRPTFPFQGTEQ